MKSKWNWVNISYIDCIKTMKKKKKLQRNSFKICTETQPSQRWTQKKKDRGNAEEKFQRMKGSNASIHVPGRRGWDADTAWWAPDAAPARLSTWSHRCASHPPSAPEDVTSTAAGRGRWSTCDVDVSMIPTRGAHLSLTACRSSVTTSFVSRLPGTRWSSAEFGVATLADVWRGRRRPMAPVLGRRDALPGRHTSMWVAERMGLDGES